MQECKLKMINIETEINIEIMTSCSNFGNANKIWSCRYPISESYFVSFKWTTKQLIHWVNFGAVIDSSNCIVIIPYSVHINRGHTPSV